MDTAWLPSTVQNGGLRCRFFRDEFLQDSSTLAAETSVCEKMTSKYDKKSRFHEFMNMVRTQNLLIIIIIIIIIIILLLL